MKLSMFKRVTEADDARWVGRRVMVVDKIEAPKFYGFMFESRIDCQANAIGIITDYHNSHGLCFEVQHEDGTKAWYDPAELFEYEP